LEFSKKNFKEENSVKENRETIGPNIIFWHGIFKFN
jgi:hypothetical protein